MAIVIAVISTLTFTVIQIKLIVKLMFITFIFTIIIIIRHEHLNVDRTPTNLCSFDKEDIKRILVFSIGCKDCS